MYSEFNFNTLIILILVFWYFSLNSKIQLFSEHFELYSECDILRKIISIFFLRKRLTVYTAPLVSIWFRLLGTGQEVSGKKKNKKSSLILDKYPTVIFTFNTIYF